MTRIVLMCPHCEVRSNFDSICEGQGGAIFLCNSCGGPVSKLRINQTEPIYPKRIPRSLHSVPDSVGSDYIEAQLCFDAGAAKATVAMCRRALQAACVQRAARGDNLKTQIDDLRSKGLIAQELADWAHEVRTVGNIGVHPDKDGLQDVTKEDAEEILKFLEEFLNYLYVMPEKVARMRASKSK